MKTLLIILSLVPAFADAQICNPIGNVMIFSNYDGGVLNIDVDVNIPNLKIGVLTYEGVTINLSGAHVNNVTAVEYAGYNANNAHCGQVINTSINGAPVGAATNITFLPTATLANPNGYTSMVCSYSCNNNVSQGGCNTADQVEDYFATLFNGVVYAHDTQYGCWSGSKMVSAGGTCCPVIPFSSTPTSSNVTCNTACDGTASVSAVGGTPPYTYLWSFGGSTTNSINGLCAGTYTVTVTDDAGASVLHTVTITEPSAIDESTSAAGTSITAANTSAGISYQWLDCDANFAMINGASSQSFTPTTTGNYAVELTLNGCSDTSACTLIDYTGIEELLQGKKEFVKIVDFLGRETVFKPNTPLIYLFGDGTRVRVMRLEE